MGTVIRPELSTKNRYWVSKHRYYELKHFCLQFPEWKRAYNDLNGWPSRSTSVSERVSGGLPSDSTAFYAETLLYFRERMELVEQAAKEAAGDMAGLMIKAVTEGVSYEHISPPCCKEIWYTAYRRFFWLLDKARK